MVQKVRRGRREGGSEECIAAELVSAPTDFDEIQQDIDCSSSWPNQNKRSFAFSSHFKSIGTHETLLRAGTSSQPSRLRFETLHQTQVVILVAKCYTRVCRGSQRNPLRHSGGTCTSTSIDALRHLISYEATRSTTQPH